MCILLVVINRLIYYVFGKTVDNVLCETPWLGKGNEIS